VTCHQFRHTLGTRLINANVPQHIVQQLLEATKLRPRFEITCDGDGIMGTLRRRCRNGHGWDASSR
jgi:integrase